jgi:hypothetical protein
MNEELIIPEDVSKWGIITAFFYFGVSLITYKYQYYLLSLLCFSVFITSILHWHRQTISGIVKIIDMIFVITLFIVFTFHYVHILFEDKYRKLWYVTAVLMVLAYIFNSIITYYQILNINKNDKYQTNYSYFSLEYTHPNTEARTLCYYTTTFVHLFFEHILPCFVTSFMFITSNPSVF